MVFVITDSAMNMTFGEISTISLEHLLRSGIAGSYNISIHLISLDNNK